MAAVLQRLARERATDPEAWRYLAMAEGAAQEPAEAVRALHRAIRLQPRRADLWEMLGQALVMQTGQVGPEAKAAFDRAVQLDPHAFIARFFLGRARIDAGDKAGGLAAWHALLADTPASDPRRAQLQAAIAMAEGQAPPAPAVSGDQMTAIRGMVQGLADRLKANPDDPQGWVRLVRAYAVLGDARARDAALAQARGRYAGHADILGQLEEAAKAPPMSR
jgi:cytochrome c-type biogenesis protein CcmH